MDSNNTFTKQQQRQSIVDAYNHPSAPSVGLEDRLRLLKSAINAGTPAPAAPIVEPNISPENIQFQHDTGNDHIAQMQAANLAQAQQDPNMAARLRAFQEAIRRHKEGMEGKQIESLQRVMQKKTPETYPSQE